MIVEMMIGAGLMALGSATMRIWIARREEARRLDASAEAERGGDAGDDEPDGDPGDSAKGRAGSRSAGGSNGGGSNGGGDGGRSPKKPRRTRRLRRSREPAGPRGLLVGDVLLTLSTELWLSGMLELDEEGFVLRLFPTPGAEGTEWVAQLDPEASDLALLRRTDEVPEGAVPSGLPVAGRRLTLERRGRAVVRQEGEHLPRVANAADYVILSDALGKVLIVLDFERAPRLALVGDRVDRATLDLLPGGDLDER